MLNITLNLKITFLLWNICFSGNTKMAQNKCANQLLVKEGGICKRCKSSRNDNLLVDIPTYFMKSILEKM